MRFRARPVALALAAFAVAGAGAALAQSNQAQGKQTQAKQESRQPAAGDVQTFGDWTLRCGTGPAGEHACEVSSMVKRPGASGPIAQIAFGRQVKDAPVKDKPAQDKAAKDAPAKDAAAPPMKLVVLIPVNVTIAPGVEIFPDPAEPALKLPIKTCVQAACFAEFVLTDEQMKAFHGRAQPGKLVFVDPGENPVPVELSFKGLDQALDALAHK